MSFNNVVEKLKPNTFIESELGKELDNELYEMEFSQNRWEGKPCVMIFFSLVKATEDRGSTVQLQSQSILHQINDLVLESCYKYKRFNSIDICKGIRRVIQIDVNDNAEVSKIGTEEGTGFNDKNSLEVVDHNKQFYRISLDVNFRNIDLVDIRPQAKHKNNLKISNKRKPKSESKSHNHAPDQRSSRKNFFSKEKALEKMSSHATTTMVALPKQNEGSQSARTKQLEKPAPKERMFMTHNKFYIKPVMSEIKEEENKSEISDSYKNREIASSEQANLSEAVKNMISNTSGVEGSTLNKNSPLFYDFEMLKTIVILVSNFVGLKASFVIDHEPLSLVNRRDEEFNKSNSLSKESSQVPKIRVILESRINDIALKNIKCLDDDYQQLDSAMKNKTMKSPAKGIKDFFQDQSGTRMYNRTSDEKSLKLKATESSRSGCLNHEDSESETEGIVSIDNENVRDRNVALRREFNFITKEARDSIQDSSRKDYSSKESSFHTEEKKRDPKSRQSKLDFVKKIEIEEPTGTQDSICVEAVPTKIRNAKTLHLLSARNKIT
ncbi:unnamed protein product [Moneuplotes crassus]|uniref:Uncharacterized protein n=1 Tax=Euplotes crassus TaxID=5936 RepID=A0AAD1Y3F4_EUPCR|nr:unnamed protein product [Moneuplotes crassus]